ncbi:MAG: tetratricopeptide repeat protein [Deltaproteobacteria bacterium]|nr:tetratricopeptide repeat protein [Deltaproteobacteria bacterium]
MVCACAATISDKDRSSAQLRYDLGIASLNQGDLRSALRELLAAVQVDPELAEAHHGLGLVFHAMGRHEDALGHYQKAVELKPTISEARNNYGVLLLDMGRYDLAIVEFQAALADILYATPSLAEGNLGWAYYRKGDVPTALKHLRNAVAINPKFCRGYGWLARIELTPKKAEQVVAYGKRYEKHCLADPALAAFLPAPFRQEMNYYLGAGQALLGDREAAREALAACVAAEVETEFKAQCQRSLAELR